MFKFLRLGRHLPSFLKSHEESNTFLEYGLLFNRVNLVFGGNGEEPVQQQRSGPDLDVIRWSVVVERGGDGIRSDGGVLACTSTSKLVYEEDRE